LVVPIEIATARTRRVDTIVVTHTTPTKFVKIENVDTIARPTAMAAARMNDTIAVTIKSCTVPSGKRMLEV
jgi:hypothetical protein